MLYPAISELEEITKSRYALVIVTAKRARQLLEASEANKTPLADKPVKLAIDDIANGKVKCKLSNHEESDDSAVESEIEE
jgi:DNA-directed RNA polymerase subunit omega